jgi:hypothetical protein
MGTEFEDTLNEITGASVAAAPENQQEQTQAAAAESNAFEAALDNVVQQPAPEAAHDTPEPGGGMEH